MKKIRKIRILDLWLNLSNVPFRMVSGVLDGRAHRRRLANTVELLCLAAMSVSATG